MNNSKYKQSALGTYYHLYNRGNQKRKIFLNDSDYEFYLKRLRQSRKKYEFTLLSYCLMPNHIHLIVRQDGNVSPSKFISSLHTSYSMMFNKKYNLVGHLFQGRYKQKIIEDDFYMKNLIAYVHLNPVKDNICKFPKEYKWSSYLEYAKDFHGICDHKFVEEYGFKGQSFEEFIRLAQCITPEDAFDV
ncbi:MAG: transposase [Patescibacteria group bacterium]|nr:transposase [Patescibacteria group bacterium]